MASSDEAKMTGTTPAWLTFTGMYVVAPPYTRAAGHPPRVLDRDAPLRLLDEDHEPDDGDDHDDRRQRQRDAPDQVDSEMRVGDAFSASLDADQDGEEGLFYVWDEDEVDAALGDAAQRSRLPTM